MIDKFFKLTGNSLLLVILMLMFAIPLSTLGMTRMTKKPISGQAGSPDVLPASSIREQIPSAEQQLPKETNTTNDQEKIIEESIRQMMEAKMYQDAVSDIEQPQETTDTPTDTVTETPETLPATE